MDNASRCLELGRQFAAALDDRDYVRAATFLADNCRYDRPPQHSLLGPQAICDSYRESDERARRAFASVVYHSDAAANSSGGVRLTFFDELRQGEATHTFRCAQIVYFNENDRIARIELAEFPGERERLQEFCTTHGVQLH